MKWRERIWSLHKNIFWPVTQHPESNTFIIDLHFCKYLYIIFYMNTNTVGNQSRRIMLLGCPFDLVTMDQARDMCINWCVMEPRQPHIVVTINAAIITMLVRDASLWEACRQGDLSVVDGVPVVWSSHILGTPLPERVAGIDLMARLLEAGGEKGLKVFFLGSTDSILDKLIEVVKTKYPGLVIVGYRNGYFSPEEYDDVIEKIRLVEPDMLFVGMPTPFKETWCFKYRDHLNVPVIMGVGGSFDVLSGVVPRAPQFMQRIGMEWFWRFLMRPQVMWKRYLVTNTLFLMELGREFIRMRLLGKPPMHVHWEDQKADIGELPRRM